MINPLVSKAFSKQMKNAHFNILKQKGDNIKRPK